MLRRLARVLAVSAATVAVGASLVATPASADPIVVPDVPGLDPETLGCLELTPHAIAPLPKPLRLDVRVLLDGADRATADRAVAAMRRAYDPLQISVVPSYEPVSFTGTDAAGLNAQAKRHYGGKRPDGIDVVYTMTSKDIKDPGSLTGADLAGQADCIGGVRFPERAFAVGEVIPDGVHSLFGIPLPKPVYDGTGKTMAHEIGHLVGAQHHYSSPEGLAAPGDPNALSLMGPHLSLISLKFSTLNTLMVQGNAQQYADH